MGSRGHLQPSPRRPAGGHRGPDSAGAALDGEELADSIRAHHVEDGSSIRPRTPVQVPVSVPVLVPVSVPVLGGVSVAQEVTQATRSVKRVLSGQPVPLAAQRAQSSSRMQAVAWAAQTPQEFV